MLIQALLLPSAPLLLAEPSPAPRGIRDAPKAQAPLPKMCHSSPESITGQGKTSGAEICPHRGTHLTPVLLVPHTSTLGAPLSR